MAADRLDKAQEVFAAWYGDHLLDHTRLYPGVRGVLAALAPAPLHLATNKPQGFSEAILAGWASTSSSAGWWEATRRRSASRIHRTWRRPSRAWTWRPQRVAMVGDSPNDILAARALGAVAVGCTYGLVAPERVRDAGPDHVIDDITDLVDLFAGDGR